MKRTRNIAKRKFLSNLTPFSPILFYQGWTKRTQYPLRSPDRSAITERWFDRTSHLKKLIVIGSMRIIIPIKLLKLNSITRIPFIRKNSYSVIWCSIHKVSFHYFFLFFIGWASGVRMLTSICASTTISEKKVIWTSYILKNRNRVTVTVRTYSNTSVW